MNCHLALVTPVLDSCVLEGKYGKTATGRSILTQAGAVTEPREADPKVLWGTVTLKRHLIPGTGSNRGKGTRVQWCQRPGEGV